ncbi:hypothetical protein SAMN05216463_10644 [Xylanibacter ruminicola]|uniref:Uncharacterized protein n=1 Tax=Xylanibacter ruminicola TaxID=839 RepID=A0A1M6TJB1_XYLRU|nr:hypothetical protein SAMN05216463_10644 [Xylanibacter ruminicola]
MNWVLTATLICGASVLTSCSSNDNPLTPDLNLSEMIIGKLSYPPRPQSLAKLQNSDRMP